MSIKYIPQLNNQNFVFPNYDLAEYDVNIVQDLNENSVSGTVTTFSATTINSTGITFTINATWYKNNADVFLLQSGDLSLASLHVLAPNQNYYKPWRLTQNFDTSVITATTININISFTVLPSQLGIGSFTTGTYYFEIRFIGAKAIYPICQTLSITVP